MATGFGSSNTTRYLTVSDHADFTLPNSDWTLLFFINHRATNSYLWSNGAYAAANTTNFFIFNNFLTININGTERNINMSGAWGSGEWGLGYARRLSGTLRCGFIKPGASAPTFGVGTSLSAGSDGGNLAVCGRYDGLSTWMFDGDLGWCALVAGAVTDDMITAIGNGQPILETSLASSIRVLWHGRNSSEVVPVVGGHALTFNGSSYTSVDDLFLPYPGQILAPLPSGSQDTGVGAATGTSTATGVGASTAAASGTGTGTSTVTAAAVAIFMAVGSAAGVGAATGVATAADSGVGAAAGTSTVTGVGASTAASGGVSTGTSTAAGTGASTAASDGASTGTGTVTGAGASTAAADGAATGTSTAAAVAVEDGSVGTAAGTSTATGVGVSTAASDGAAAGTSTVTGTANSTVAADGAAVGTSTAAAISTLGATPADGAAAGTSTATGVGASTAAADGAAAGTGGAAAVATSTAASDGAAAGTSTAAGFAIEAVPSVPESRTLSVQSPDRIIFIQRRY